jgi:nitrate/nitrite-specific signal transduction histidine kinase
MIGRRLGAHSLSVWEINDNTSRVRIAANFDDDRLHVATQEETQASQQVELATQDHPVWTEFFRSGEHCVFGEIDSDPPRVRMADGPDTRWHHWFGDAVANPIVPVMTKRLSALGVVATLCVPMFVGGKVSGLISIRFQQKRAFRCEEVELARALAHQAMLAIQLMRLSQLSRQAAVVAERNRLARDIHDTLAQGLTGVIVQLEAAEDAQARNLVKDAAAHVERASELAREGLQEPLQTCAKELAARTATISNHNEQNLKKVTYYEPIPQTLHSGRQRSRLHRSSATNDLWRGQHRASLVDQQRDASRQGREGIWRACCYHRSRNRVF